MDAEPIVVERVPTPEEYQDLIASLGWRPRQREAVRIALDHSLFAVCAEIDAALVGFGRVIGDGGLHYYLADVVVRPEHQGRGIGSRIVAALTRYVEAIPYSNSIVGVIPTPGLIGFYARYGFKAQGPDAPALYRWVNPAERIE